MLLRECADATLKILLDKLVKQLDGSAGMTYLLLNYVFSFERDLGRRKSHSEAAIGGKEFLNCQRIGCPAIPIKVDLSLVFR